MSVLAEIDLRSDLSSPLAGTSLPRYNPSKVAGIRSKCNTLHAKLRSASLNSGVKSAKITQSATPRHHHAINTVIAPIGDRMT